MTDFNPYKFVLVGSLEGSTINLGGHQFIDGVFTLEGPEPHIAPSVEESNLKAVYLGKSYQAFREGSPEHTEAVKRLKNNKSPEGELDVAERERQDQVNNFQPPVEPVVVESSATIETTVTEKATDDASVDTVVTETVTTETVVTETPAAEAEAAPTQSTRQKQGALRSALLKLDPKDAAHWTDNGLPSVAAVRQFAGDDTISRAAIQELAPKMTREEAAKAAA